MDFRAVIAASLAASGPVLFNVIDALAVGPRARSPAEITDSALFAYSHHSLYQALRHAAEALGEAGPRLRASGAIGREIQAQRSADAPSR
jgi:hypothetical protein